MQYGGKEMLMDFEMSDKYPLPKRRATPCSKQGRKGDGRMEAVAGLKPGWSFRLATTKGGASILLWWARARFADREFTFRQEKSGEGVRIWRTK